MNTMDLSNPYLKETVLTSTKNKYILNLEQPLHERKLNIKFSKHRLEMVNKQRSFPISPFLKKSKDKFDLCHIESLRLKKDLPAFLKRSKKKRCDVNAFRSVRDENARYEDRDVVSMDCMDNEESFHDRVGTLADGYPIRTNALFGQATTFAMPRNAPSFGFSTNDLKDLCPPSGMVFGSAPSAAPPAVCGMVANFIPPGTSGTGAFFSKDLLEMPSYRIGEEWQVALRKENLFESSDTPEQLNQLEKINEIKHKKMLLLNCASQALFTPADFKNDSDEYRLTITKYADDVYDVDPEFILKVALYCRQELHLRTVANYLLSYAAFRERTRLFLEKYFEACIVLPTDWIDVAELYQVFGDQSLKARSLPSALKRVMKKTFLKFDAYQLAKYNRSKKRKTKSNVDSSDAAEDAHVSIDFTLKQLIRLNHIDKPSYEIMCILGKKYPDSPSVFKECNLPDSWDPELAGTRMKLPQPMTWETQISTHGNKAHVWERLLENHNVPYMALLRNLRNIILAGISAKHHDTALKYLQNKNAVLNSRQLPLQFYEAYKVLVSIEELLSSESTSSVEEAKHSFFTEELRPKRQKISVNMQAKLENATSDILQRYKKAISEALEISVLQNLPPVPGKSLVICIPSQEECYPIKLSSNTKTKASRLCIMVGLMCLKASEDCEAVMIHGAKCDAVALNGNNSFLQNFIHFCRKSEESDSESDVDEYVRTVKSILDHHLTQQALLKERLDHVIFLKGRMSPEVNSLVSTFLRKYRELINPDLLFTDINFDSAAQKYSAADDGKNVYLCGNSPQIMKFIAERSTGGQLNCVENIDSKYNLSSAVVGKPISHPVMEKQDATVLNANLPKWHTVKVFISSTFKDMHSERDVLVRYVLPELRKRAASVFVKIHEIDLRWGITETDCASKRAAELCLLEAQRSDLFVGILGQRYGSLYNFDPPDSPELNWVKDLPKGLSITELEMHAGALREEKSSKQKGFFYFRSDKFYNGIPPNHKKDFSAENEESSQKVGELKRKILASSNNVFPSYSFNFAGVLKGKPVLGGLESFGQRVLNDLWQAISETHKKDPFADEFLEEENSQTKFLNSLDYIESKKTLDVNSFIGKIEAESGIFLISGLPGCGKTTFIVNMLKKLINSEHPVSVVKFFVGLTPRSNDVSYMLKYICKVISKYYTVSAVFPKLMNDILNCFPDVLREAVAYGGGQFFLVLDGLDHLNFKDQLLDWLPLDLPEGLRIICTASDSSYVYNALNERQLQQNAVHIYTLPLMAQSDRECLVRHYLRLYGKALDESAFNNQMLKLVTKKDSGIPLFLRLGCDFLRCYGEFENFTSMLQSLPTSIPTLLQEIIVQMENTYTTVLVQNTLTLLGITKEGLDDADLHLLLSVVSTERQKNASFDFDDIVTHISQIGPDDKLSHVTYCSLIHCINTFAYGNNRPRKVNLSGSEFEKVVQKYYLNKNYATLSSNMHCLLAAYYKTLCDPENNKSWTGQSPTAYRSLLYHLYDSHCFVELSESLCSIRFLEAAFRVEISDTLLEYYSIILCEKKNLNNKTLKKVDLSLLSAYYDFVCRNMHILQKYPGLVSQQALNEPSNSRIKLTYSDSKSRKIECVSKILSEQRIITLGGFVKNITAAVCEDDKQLALLGSEDGKLKVLDFDSKRIIRSFRGHSSEITCICSAGKDRVCTASTDTTLSIWSTVDFNRIAVLKGHRRNVSCCCVDLTSNILLSSGWDNSVRLWSLADGRSISVIEDFSCPVNCIDQNPVKTQIAVGLWSGCIEIWDTMELKRKDVFKSSYRSVKSIAFSPDGINIISSYMNSNILIWSSEHGLKMSSLKGHILPVNSISYSMTSSIVISGSADSTLKVWSMQTGVDVQSLSACKMCPISLLQFTTPNLIGIAFQNGEVWIQDITNDLIVCKWHPDSDMVSCISRSSDKILSSTRFIFGTQSGAVMVGNTVTNELTSIGQICTRVTSLFHNEKIVLAANIEGDIGIFSISSSKSKVISGGHHGLVSALSLFFHNDMLWALSAGSDKTVKLWQINENEIDMCLQKEYVSKHKDLITYCCWFQKTQVYEKYFKFLSGSHDNNVILQDENSVLHFHGLKTSVRSIDFTDNCIIGCGVDGSLAVWSLDAALLTYISGIDQSSAVLTFDVLKGLENEIDVTLAFVDIDGSLKVRKPIQKSCVYSLEGHSKAITSCCTNTNGDLLSCSRDGTINLWKIPSDKKFDQNHAAFVKNVIIFSDLAVSSDSLGNICVWKIDEAAIDSSLVYVAKENYACGFVNTMCKMGKDKFVCGVTQNVNGEEKYFIDTLNLVKRTSKEKESNTVCIQRMDQFFVQSDVNCLSANDESKTIVAGLKSGELAVCTPKVRQVIKISEEWILNASVLLVDDATEYIFVNMLNSDTHRYRTAKLISTADATNTPYRELLSSSGDTPFFTAFSNLDERRICCGDTKGRLHLISVNLSENIIKDVHNATITGISVSEGIVFTSSLDRTVKGWNLSTLEQVCQFHLPVTITCIVAKKVAVKSAPTFYVLLIGTSSGSVHFLKYYS